MSAVARPPASSARQYRVRQSRTQWLRHISQAAVVLFILTASVIHNLATMDGTTASIDALCPFGGLETLWQWIVSGGSFALAQYFAANSPITAPFLPDIIASATSIPTPCRS